MCRAPFSRGAAGNGGRAGCFFTYPRPQPPAPNTRFSSFSSREHHSAALSPLLPAPSPPLRPPGPPARPRSPHPHPALTASPALRAPLADPERVHTRWLLSVGASREMNSELESRRSKGGRRQRLSRAAMRGGQAALLRRTTIARGTRPAPAGRARRPDLSAALPPARSAPPAAAAPGPHGGSERGALRPAPQPFGAQNSERCAGGAGRGGAGPARPAPPRSARGSLRRQPPLRPYPPSARAQPGWLRFPQEWRSGCPHRAQRFLLLPQPRSERPWRGPRLVMRRRCRPAPPAPTAAATGKGAGGGRAGAPRTAARRRDSPSRRRERLWAERAPGLVSRHEK